MIFGISENCDADRANFNNAQKQSKIGNLRQGCAISQHVNHPAKKCFQPKVIGHTSFEFSKF